MPVQETDIILLIEDDPGIAELVRERLAERRWEVECVRSGQEAASWLDRNRPRLVLLDYSLPDLNAAEFLDRRMDMPPFIVTTGAGDEGIAVAMMKRGARDYVVKDAHFLENLPLIVEHVLKELDTERQLAEAERNLRRMNERFVLATRAARLGVWDWDLRGNELVWDERMYQLYGLNRDDFGGAYEAWLRGVHPDDRARCDLESERARSGEKEYDTEFRVIWPDGSTHHLKAYGQVLRDADGSAARMIGINFDVTEQIKAENALRDSLAEKDVLLKEVHHRVKNNLASISSLISLQQSQLTDARVIAEYDDLARRVQAMALVHELLYQTKSLSRIDMQEYFETLASRLLASYRTRSAVALSVRSRAVTMTLDSAIPCGLIVNELITNALKYAFPSGQARPGETECGIVVEAQQDDQRYTLTVSDNGIGLPEGWNWKEARSLGMQLVMMLGQHQLKGKAELEGTRGVVFRVQFEV